jgi:hypothetical protein
VLRIGMACGIDTATIAARFDPLAGHEDLKDLVDAGEMPRALAVETAQGRNLRAHAQQQSQAQQQTAAQQDAIAKAHDAAKQDLNALGTQLATEDRARIDHYLADGTLGRLIAETKAKFPTRPELWADKVEVAYRRLPALAPKPAPVVHTPARSATPLPPAIQPDFKALSPEAALDMALGLG